MASVPLSIVPKGVKTATVHAGGDKNGPVVGHAEPRTTVVIHDAPRLLSGDASAQNGKAGRPS
jgi:hypothetical protein